ncbi:hypothetical protein BASA81_002065 [Batrachochytrium salamandrivorans]|nr:hypothetical protein BASA81_002065 [Batrachochytrium salamandrivorans]
MQVVLNANKASLVQNTLIKDGVQDLSYSTGTSFPIVSKSNSAVPPTTSFTGAPDNNSHSFNIPKSNFNYLGRLKFSADATFIEDESYTFSALNLIRNVQFKSNGQPILSMDGEAFKALIMNSPAPFQINAFRYAQALEPTDEEPIPGDAGTHKIVTYVPLLASWYQSIEKALNTSKLGQIDIQVTYKTYSESGLTAPLANFIAKFECYKYAPDPETYNKMVLKDFSKPIIMECFNTHTERFQVTLSATQATEFQFASGVLYNVYKSHLFVAKVGTNGGTDGGDPVVSPGCPQLQINSISLEVGGDTYLNNYTRSMVNYEQAVRGFSSLVIEPSIDEAGGDDGNVRGSKVSFNENQAYVVEWSLGCHRDYNTGLASMANLNKPAYTIKLPKVNAGEENTYWVYLVHEYWNILEVQAGTTDLVVRANQ